MFCRICGKYILDDSNFCQYCGAEIKETSETIDKVIVLSKQEATNGILKKFELKGVEKPLIISVPPKVNDGQLFCLHKVKIIDDKGKKIKKDILVKLEIEK